MDADLNIELRPADAFAELPTLDDDSFHAAIIDYPWELDTQNGTDRFGHDQSTGESDLYGTVTNNHIQHIFSEVSRIVKQGGWVFSFADDDVYPLFRRLIDESQLERRRTAYWDSVTMGMGYYHRVQAYPLIPATAGKTERYIQDRPNIYTAKQHGPSAEYHTQKPVELMRQILAPPVLERGERVLVPFAGTFPEAVVCQERGCEALGFEIDERAIDIAEERMGQPSLSRFENG